MSRPKHVFTNVLSRPPDKVREQCEAVQSAKMEERRQTLRYLSKDQHTAARGQLGNELVAGLSGILDNAEFKPQAYCKAHNCDCAWLPRAVCDMSDKIWME
eukprot:4893915-Alexandrium_andersonii.AAC.1